MSAVNRLETGSLNTTTLVRLRDVTKLIRRVHHPDSRKFLLRKIPELEPVTTSSLTASPITDILSPIEAALDLENRANTDRLRVFRIINKIDTLKRQVRQSVKRPESKGEEIARAVEIALRSVGKPFNSLSLLEQQAVIKDLENSGFESHPPFKQDISRLAYLETQ